MTADELDEIERLLKVATPGPWGCFNGYGPLPQDGLMRCARIGGVDGERQDVLRSGPGCADISGRREDFELICRLRNAAEALVAIARDRSPATEVSHA